MTIAFEVSDIMPASQAEVYRAWLSSEEHAQMTGSPAQVSAEVGGEFEAWDGYIHGRNLELDPPRRILQRWRTVEFADTDEDSLLEISIEEQQGGSKVTIRHTGLPEDGMQYREGWRDSYFTPMKKYFEERNGNHDDR
jgi:activator of HSP90 ATPase